MEQDEQIIAVYEVGYSVEEISEAMGLPMGYIDDVIDEYEEAID